MESKSNLEPKLITYPAQLTGSLAQIGQAFTRDRRVTIVNIHVADTSGSGNAVDIVYNDGSTDFYICKAKTLSANDCWTINVGSERFAATEDGYSIKARYITGSADIFLTVLESEGRPLTQ
jgi:hypothetical protein